jgi:hypothetical protein
LNFHAGCAATNKLRHAFSPQAVPEPEEPEEAVPVG